jgi:hypothetical protein
MWLTNNGTLGRVPDKRRAEWLLLFLTVLSELKI